MERLIRVASGQEKADVVFKNGQVLNFFTKQLITADVAVVGTRIAGVGSYDGIEEIDCRGKFLTAGLIDAHMHIESTMATPLEFTKLALPKGTTGVFIDPHEIVNVVGLRGLDFLLDHIQELPIDFRVMMPSSVPATDFDHNGAGKLTAEEMVPYVKNRQVFGLAEVMRLADVTTGEAQMMDILSLFQQHIKDGHAPGVTGKSLQAYKAAGIDNDHESEDYAEALEKLQAGFKLLIREGSAARNLEKIVTGLVQSGIDLENCMFCTDDKHLEDIEKEGHINYCVRRAIALGVAPIDAYKMASFNTARSFGLENVGAIAAGYQADIVVLDDLSQAEPILVMKSGKVVDVEALQQLQCHTQAEAALTETVRMPQVTTEDLQLKVGAEQAVIELVPHSLVTKKKILSVPQKDGVFQANEVFNKIAVIERHHCTGQMGVGVLCGFGLKNAAIGTSVSHDAHNVTVVGDNDADMLLAIEEIARMQGGLVLVSQGQVVNRLPLTLAGVMSLADGATVKQTLAEMIQQARAQGVAETVEPFMTLSFLSLAVIPEIRITDSGLFDVCQQAFIKERR